MKVNLLCYSIMMWFFLAWHLLANSPADSRLILGPQSWILLGAIFALTMNLLPPKWSGQVSLLFIICSVQCRLHEPPHRRFFFYVAFCLVQEHICRCIVFLSDPKNLELKKIQIRNTNSLGASKISRISMGEEDLIHN